MDLDKLEKLKDKFKEDFWGWNDGDIKDLLEEYCEFSVFIQTAFIYEHGYLPLDTGKFQNANYVMLDMIYNKIKKHPLLWKLFMIA